MQFGVARFFLGLGESGNFPAAIKTVASGSESERSWPLASSLRSECRSDLGPALCPGDAALRLAHAAFLTTGVFSVLWILWWFPLFPATQEHSTLTA